MIELKATNEAICILPNPEFNDVRHLDHEINIKRAVNSNKRTYVKRKFEQVFTFSFVLTRAKSLELLNFMRTYGSTKLTVTNHDLVVIEGYVISDPIVVTKNTRETVLVDLEIKGVIQ